jgi:hypothetical protein
MRISLPAVIQSIRQIHKTSVPSTPWVHAYSWDLLLHTQTLPVPSVFLVSSTCLLSHPHYEQINDHTVMFINLSPPTYYQVLSIIKDCGLLSVRDIAQSRCLHCSTLRMEAASSSKCWYTNTKVYSVIIQTTTSLICTTNLRKNSTLHDQQNYTPITQSYFVHELANKYILLQSEVQQHWHYCK